MKGLRARRVGEHGVFATGSSSGQSTNRSVDFSGITSANNVTRTLEPMAKLYFLRGRGVILTEAVASNAKR